MRANRHSKYFAVLLTAGALMFGACSKDKKDSTDEGAARPGHARFSYLPKESSFVVGVHPQQIAASTLFKELVEPTLAQNPENELQKLKDKCGFDPLTTVGSVTMGGDPEQDNNVFSVSGISKDQLIKCAPALAAEEGQKIEVTDDGGYTKITADGETTYLGWLDDKTLVGSSKAKDKATIEAVVKSTEGLDKNVEMMKLIGLVDTKASVWFVLHNANPEKPVAGVPVQAKGMFGAINLSQGLGVNLTIQQSTPEEAQSTVATMTQQLDALKQATPLGKYLSKLEMKAEGSDAQFVLNLSNEEVKELVPLVQQQLLPMMMMMGGGMGGGMPQDDVHGGAPAEGAAPEGAAPEGAAPEGAAPAAPAEGAAAPEGAE
jgi:hypothetical protein